MEEWTTREERTGKENKRSLRSVDWHGSQKRIRGTHGVGRGLARIGWIGHRLDRLEGHRDGGRRERKRGQEVTRAPVGLRSEIGYRRSTVVVRQRPCSMCRIRL